MPNKVTSLYTSPQLIADVDVRAKELRRSRNSIIIEAVEKFIYPPNSHAPEPKPTLKKKAGKK